MEEPGGDPEGVVGRGIPGWAGVLVLAVGFGLLWWRAPLLLGEPRLWAEEGSCYLAAALRQSPLATVAMVPDWVGYLGLAANLAAVVGATAVPLEGAAAAMTGSALLVQAWVVALLASGRSLWFGGVVGRMAALVALLGMVPTAEIWLTMLGAQFWCLVAALLILGEDLRESSTRRRWFSDLSLGFAVLGGVAPVLAAPAFLARARLLPDPAHRRQAWIAIAGAGLQLAALAMTAGRNPELLGPRWRGMEPGMAAVVTWTRVVVLPVLGLETGSAHALAFRRLAETDGDGFSVVATSLGIVLVVAVGVAGASLDRVRAILLGTALVPCLGAALGSGLGRAVEYLDPVHGSRYLVGPCWLLELGCAALAGSGGRDRGAGSAGVSLVARALLALMAVAAFRDGRLSVYRSFVLPHRHLSWAAEVARARREPGYHPRIWPAFGEWRVELPPMGPPDSVP